MKGLNATIVAPRNIPLRGEKFIKKISLSIGGLLGIVNSTTVLAHVKWFETNEGKFEYDIFVWDPLTFSIIMGAMIFLILSTYFELLTYKNTRALKVLRAPLAATHYIHPLLKLAVAILFLGNIIQGHFVAPNIPTLNPLFETWLQAGLILCLLYKTELFSALLLLLSAGLFYVHGFDIAIDYCFELAAIALGLWTSKPRNRSADNQVFYAGFYTSQSKLGLATTCLRLGLGIQLIVLSLHDKLLDPGLALHFLENNAEFNFMRWIGFQTFSDIHFVLASGLAELIFGLSLLANASTRISAGLIVFFFALTGVVLGPQELLGHIPILAVALILLLNPAPAMRNRPQFMGAGVGDHPPLQSHIQYVSMGLKTIYCTSVCRRIRIQSKPIARATTQTKRA